MNLNLIKPFWNFCKKHSTKILAGTAIACEVAGFYCMHKEAPIARKRLDELDSNAKFLDKLKVTMPIYWPAFLMLLASSGCIIGGCVVGEAKLIAMTNLAMASDAALHRLEKKTVEQLGPEKALELQKSVTKDMMSEKPIEAEYIHPTANGTDIFFDPLSSRYFMSSESAVKTAAEKICKSVFGYDMWATVNEWYSELDIPQAKLGNGWGWNIDHPLKIELSDGRTSDGRRCYMIDYWEWPMYYDGKS